MNSSVSLKMRRDELSRPWLPIKHFLGRKHKQTSKIQHLSKPFRSLERTDRYRSHLVASNVNSSTSACGHAATANQPPCSATIFIPFLALCDPGIFGGLFVLFGFFPLVFFQLYYRKHHLYQILTKLHSKLLGPLCDILWQPAKIQQGSYMRFGIITATIVKAQLSPPGHECRPDFQEVAICSWTAWSAVIDFYIYKCVYYFTLAQIGQIREVRKTIALLFRSEMFSVLLQREEFFSKLTQHLGQDLSACKILVNLKVTTEDYSERNQNCKHGHLISYNSYFFWCLC